MNGKVVLGARILLGLIFTIFGSNGLMMILTGKGFIPMPAPTPEMAKAMGGIFGTGYIMPIVKTIQVVSGVCLLSGRFVNLALILLGPILVNIFFIHLLHDVGGLPMGVFANALWIFLLYSRRDELKVLVKM